MSEPYRTVSALPSGTAVARYIQALALGCDDLFAAVQLADQWRDTPHVKATLELRTKAAVAAGTTSDSTWAGPLASYGLAQEAIAILRGMSILGKLEGQMRRVPFHTKVPVESGTGFTGGWVAEGGAVPVQKTTYSTSIAEFYKFGAVTVLSEELVTTSDPAAVPTINRAILGGLAASIDNQFLLPTVALSAGVTPASVLNGSTERITTGSGAAAVAADLASMLGSVSTAGPLTWVMRPRTMYYIALTLGSQAAGLPATLFGIPCIASVGSPAQVALLDPQMILYADSGQFDLSASRNAVGVERQPGESHGRQYDHDLDVSTERRSDSIDAWARVVEFVADDLCLVHDCGVRGPIMNDYADLLSTEVAIVIREALATRDARLDHLEQRLTAFETKPHVKFVGVYKRGQEYAAGDAAVHQGSLWICKAPTTGAPNEDHVGWQLAVKNGAAT